MEKLKFGRKTYAVDDDGFLIEHDQWEEDFARQLAPTLGIENGLSEKHWNVIRFIRQTYEREGKCPLVYDTCKKNGLHLKDLKDLFPTGYLRGACKLAGLTYKEGFHGAVSFLPVESAARPDARPSEKTYVVDARGFLVDPRTWDEHYARCKAEELGMWRGLTEQHWKIIRYLRDRFEKNGSVPTIYETCEANNVDLEDLEHLFPTGYHRGAVKLAGLRVR